MDKKKLPAARTSLWLSGDIIAAMAVVRNKGHILQSTQMQVAMRAWLEQNYGEMLEKDYGITFED